MKLFQNCMNLFLLWTTKDDVWVIKQLLFIIIIIIIHFAFIFLLWVNYPFKDSFTFTMCNINLKEHITEIKLKCIIA